MRELLAIEAERRPDWALVATNDSDEKLARKDDLELLLAETIVLPSKFVRVPTTTKTMGIDEKNA